MSDFEFLRYLHLAIFTAWVVAVVSLVFVVLRDKLNKNK